MSPYFLIPLTILCIFIVYFVSRDCNRSTRRHNERVKKLKDMYPIGRKYIFNGNKVTVVGHVCPHFEYTEVKLKVQKTGTFESYYIENELLPILKELR